MKKILTLCITLLAGCVAALAAGPYMAMLEKSHDFGTIKEKDGVVSYEFEFVNKGDEPLLIMSAKASCGCTKPIFPKHPVAPGKSGRIKVSYNPAGRPGEFNKTVRVRTNMEGKDKNTTLVITGVVVPKK
ncbi:MAG: DUF1573 domain-containing protein [Pseudoflavonifractor sp.]|nr:DUF1573 domain-containing protein [Pseudoflavonifractor sp.]